MNRLYLIFALLLSIPLVTLEWSGTAVAQNVVAQNVVAQDKAAQRLDEVAAFYSAVNHFQVTYSFGAERFGGGQESRNLRQTGRVIFDRPLRLSVTTEGQSTPTLVCDGEQLFAFVAATDRYRLATAPVNLRGILRDEVATLIPAATPVLTLIDQGAAKRWIDEATDITWGDDQTIDGVTCQSITVADDNRQTTLWIQKGDRPWVRRSESEVRVDGKGFVYKLPRQVIEYANWDTTTKPTDQAFAIPDPDDAKQVESLVVRTRPFLDSHPLLGVEVSDARIDMIDGSVEMVSDFEDRQVLVLAFWNTWSPPCVDAMALIEELSGELPGDDIAFRAINAGESFEDARKFLTKHSIKLPAAIDEQGFLSERFIATSTPMVVIIDRQSVVQAVHVGYTEESKNQWTRDIIAVRNDQSLAQRSWDETRDQPGIEVTFPEGKDAKTKRDTRAARYEFNRRTMVDPYREVGARNAKWDTEAETFLDEMAKHFARIPDAKKAAELISLGDAVIQLGCDDPLVLYCHALLQHRSEEKPWKKKKAMQVIERVYPDLVIRRYPANRCYSPASHLRNFYTDVEKNSRKAKKYLDGCWKHTLAMLLQDDVNDDGTLVIADEVMNFFHSLPMGLRGNYFFSAKKYEDESRWLVNVIGGELHIDKAWEARGGDWAPEVTPEGWDGFNDHLRRARNCFRRAHRVAPNRPQAAAGMITVAMGSSMNAESEMQMWFKRVVDAQLDYNAAYHRLFNGLRPRWHGSLGQMLQFGRQCARTQRYDTDLPYMLYEAAWKIMGDVHNSAGDDFAKRPGLYDELADVSRGYVADRIDKGDDADWFRTVWLGFAYHAEKWEDARRLIDEMDGQLDADAMGRFPLRGDTVLADVMSRTGPHRDEISYVDAAIQDGDYADAIIQIDRLLANKSLHPSLAKRLRSKRVACGWRVKLAAGQRASLLPESDEFPGWQLRGGQWIKRHTGAIRVESRDDGMAAISEIDFGPRWKLSCDIVHGASPFARWNAGIGLYVDGDRKYAIEFNPKREFVVADLIFDRYEKNVPFKPKSDTVHFEVQMNDGVVDVWCDGKHLIKQKPLPNWSPGQKHYVSIGGHYRYADAVLTYRSLGIEPID